MTKMAVGFSWILFLISTPAAWAVTAVAPQAGPQKVTVDLQGKSGKDVQGTVTLEETPNGVQVSAEVRGLEKNKEHGFHIHEKGDCSAPDATSAGGHFNPGQQPHGAPGDQAHHMGDLGNIKADAKGQGKLLKTFAGLTLSGPQTILNRALVVHAQPDDLKSQPAGNAGPRIACGVIQVKK